MKEKFESAIKKEQKQLDRCQHTFSLTGNVRLVLAVLFAVNIYLNSTRWHGIAGKLSAAFLLAVQIAVWRYHSRLRQNIDHADGIIGINNRHLDRIEERWTAFPDTGKEFADPRHPYCNDLDIIGPKSLFQFLNTTHTWYGRHAFVQALLDPACDKTIIQQRQAAIRELSQDTAFTSELEYRFAKIGNDAAAPELVKKLQDNSPFIRSKILRGLLLYVPLATLLLAGFVMIILRRPFYPIVFYLYAIQMFLWLAGVSASHKYLKSISHLPFQLGAYSTVLNFIAETSFKSERLQQLKKVLTDSEASATQALKELAKIESKASVRSNALVYFILNVLLLWDYECAFSFADWRHRYAPHCEQWFLALGELESLSCFAVLPNVCRHTCYPHMPGTDRVEATKLGHPLIPDDKRVTNSLRLQDNILIITGSNMSGKTTWLRTVGINIVLARAGSPVCANDMAFADFHLHTSMRNADDLNEGISTFYAELKRVKGILDAAGKDRHTLFLIDEIFRGTNSADRLTGARTVLTRLNEMGVSGMITTHDLELCELEQTASNIHNYNFSEYYENNQICFDYQMRPGKSRTTNARYLMEMLGII